MRNIVCNKFLTAHALHSNVNNGSNNDVQIRENDFTEAVWYGYKSFWKTCWKTKIYSVWRKTTNFSTNEILLFWASIWHFHYQNWMLMSKAGKECRLQRILLQIQFGRDNIGWVWSMLYRLIVVIIIVVNWDGMQNLLQSVSRQNSSCSY